MPIFLTPKSLVGVVGLSGIVAGGVGIYTLTSSNSKKLNGQRNAFEKLGTLYRYSRLFNGSSGRKIKLETIDPDDKWWGERWEKYKKENPTTKLKEEEKNKAKSSLEGFQSICFQEIQRWGGYFPSTAAYADDAGKLNISIYSGHSSDDELDEQRFAWEWCSKVTVNK